MLYIDGTNNNIDGTKAPGQLRYEYVSWLCASVTSYSLRGLCTVK